MFDTKFSFDRSVATELLNSHLKKLSKENFDIFIDKLTGESTHSVNEILKFIKQGEKYTIIESNLKVGMGMLVNVDISTIYDRSDKVWLQDNDFIIDGNVQCKIVDFVFMPNHQPVIEYPTSIGMKRQAVYLTYISLIEVV